MDYKRLSDSIRKNWQFVLSGVVLIGGVVWGWDSTKLEWWKLGGMLIIGIIPFLLVYVDYRDGVAAEDRVTEDEFQTPEMMELDLPFSAVLDNFKLLEQLDENTAVSEQEGFVSWNPAYRASVITIARLNENGWMALYRISGTQLMKASLITEVCAAHKIKKPKIFNNRQAHGVAIYQSGKLSVYPAVWAYAFRSDFLETVLQKSTPFKQWAEDYYDEEEA